MTNNDPLHRRQSNPSSDKFSLAVESLEQLEQAVRKFRSVTQDNELLRHIIPIINPAPDK